MVVPKISNYQYIQLIELNGQLHLVNEIFIAATNDLLKKLSFISNDFVAILLYLA